MKNRIKYLVLSIWAIHWLVFLSIVNIFLTPSSAIETASHLEVTKWLAFFAISGVSLWVSLYMGDKLNDILTLRLVSIDIENPLEDIVFEELQPLLHRIHNANVAKDELEEMRKEFSANVSHELKTPLTSISGYAELMQNNMVKSEDMGRFCGKIYDESQRLLHLIEDILKISSLDERGLDMAKEEVDLFALSRDICSRLSLELDKNHIKLTLTGKTVYVKGIKSILDEMIYNLCENAIKYNKEDGMVEVWVGSTLDGAKVIVSDTGVGIPQIEKGRVFERFYRVDKSHSKDTGGTGLGLSIVKHGAKIHNANINLESEHGKGTKISVSFPK